MKQYEQKLLKRLKEGSKLDIVVIGGGPVGLSFALYLAELHNSLARCNSNQEETFINQQSSSNQDQKLSKLSIRVYERRIHYVKGKGYEWEDWKQGNRRREQVVTIQNSVLKKFKSLSNSIPGFIDFIEKKGEKVWIDSYNLPIREIEDTLLEYVQHLDDSIIKLQSPSLIYSGNNENEYKEWLFTLNADLIVCADGAASLSRRAFNDHFQWTSLGSTDPENLVETDYTLGVSLAPETDPDINSYPQSMNVALTLCQNRYLLNSQSGGRGYLNIRITKEEFDLIVQANDGKACPFAAPTRLYNVYHSLLQRYGHDYYLGLDVNEH